MSVDGLDGVFIGPQDLSVNLGYPDAPWSATMRDNFEKIALAAQEHGLALGIQVGSDEQAVAAVDLGARYISCAGDVTALTDGMAALPAIVRKQLRSASHPTSSPNRSPSP